MRFFKSFAVGVASSISLAALVFLLAPRTGAVSAYLAPGVVIAGSFSRFIPTSLIYRVVPDGGPTVFVAEAFACSLMFWSLVFGVGYRYARRR